MKAAAGLREDYRKMTMADFERQTEHMPLGTAKEVTERIIGAAEAAGANQVRISLNRGALPQDMFLEQIRRFAREVLPALQAHEVRRVPLGGKSTKHNNKSAAQGTPLKIPREVIVSGEVRSAVEEVLENQPFGALQLRVVLLCALVQAFDGFDLGTIGMAAPTLAKVWGVPVASKMVSPSLRPIRRTASGIGPPS
jgi:hypothetical protein